jgi:hypothetical protein
MVSLMIFVFLVVGFVLIPPALVLGRVTYKILSNLGLNLSTPMKFRIYRLVKLLDLKKLTRK